MIKRSPPFSITTAASDVGEGVLRQEVVTAGLACITGQFTMTAGEYYYVKVIIISDHTHIAQMRGIC